MRTTPAPDGQRAGRTGGEIGRHTHLAGTNAAVSGGSGQRVSKDVLTLQALAGNSAVLEALGRGQVRAPRRCTNPSPRGGAVVVSRQPKGKGAGESVPSSVEVGRELEARIDRVLDRTTALHKSIIQSIEGGVSHIDATVKSLNTTAGIYQSAYDSVKSVIDAGKGSLAAQEAWANAILGIAIGTGVGLALGAVTVFAKSAAKGADLVGRVVTEVGGEVVEFGAGKGLGALGPSGGGGSEAFLDRMNPLLKRLDIYQQASTMYRELALLAPKLGALGSLAKPAAALKADSRELAVRGKLGGTASVEVLRARVTALEAGGVRAAAVEADIQLLLAKTLEARVASEREAAGQSERRMERQLWLRWMASLKGDDDIDVLRSGPVRSRMRNLRLLGRGRPNPTDIGWDAGVAYTESESKEGVDIASQISMALGMVGKEAPIGDINNYGGGAAWGTVIFKDMPWYKREWTIMVDTQKDSIANGAMVRVTHVWGQGNKRPWLYGRLVASSEPDSAWAERARWRRDLL